MQQLLIKSHAKINIGLKILSRRADGYHNIETIFQELDLCDEIRLAKSTTPMIKISSNVAQLPTGAENICYRAIESVQSLTGETAGVDIYINKRIPLGAGLGGGSSNAAAVLKGYCELYQLKIAPDTLIQVASKLGADVPFFLEGGAALATGIGDKLEPIHLPSDYYCVLAYPNIEISTKWAYKNINFSLTKTKKIIKLPSIALNQIDFFEIREFVENDFEGIVFKRHPGIAALKKILYQQGAFFASLSGSGSTMYGLFTSEQIAKQAVFHLPESCQKFLTKPEVSQHKNKEQLK
ncbi:MAG TPA: 4-(cytidine 5'-diphospho)-2-C-methyl-D-erythritol kinase [bacterium]|nr:4-(cytidine 5'-diphospho)-2-C-methyl-D-erythritol kinase [bacterium]